MSAEDRAGAGRSMRAGLVALSLCLLAHGAWAEDLLDAWDIARQHDPVLRAAEHSHDAALQRLPQARAGLLPSVGLVGSSNRQSGDASFADSPFMDRDARNRNWTVQLSQPLWRPAQWIGYEQAERQLALADEQLHLARQDAMLPLAQAYFDALLAHESLRVAQGQRAAVQLQLELASRNFEVGIATVTEKHEAQARRDLASAQEAGALAEVQARLAELERSLGRPPRALATLRPQEESPPPPVEDVAVWMERARQQHPAVRIQEAALTVAEAEISRSKAAYGPTLDLVTSYGRSYASGSIASPADVASRVITRQVGINLNMPLFAGGALSARLRETLALRDKAEDELEAARRQAAASARQAWSALQHARLQIDALSSAVQSSRSAVEDNRIGYRMGNRINLDVLNAEQQLYAAQRELFKARADVLLQRLRLQAAAGLLEEGDLAVVNGLLEVSSTHL